MDIEIRESDYAEAMVVDRRFDVSWTGLDGVRVGGWLYRPTSSRARMPAVVYYPGYGGQVWDRADLARRGFVALAASPRGGSLNEPAYREAVPSQLQHGLDSPEHYAFRGVYADAVQALDVLRTLPEVDQDRIYACGASCGAAMAVAAAAIDGGVRAVSAEIPFMTDFDRLFEQPCGGPYAEVTDYVKEHPEQAATVRRTLGYFDTVSLAKMVTVPVLLSCGEADTVCPAATVRTLFEALPGVKALVSYPELQHERCSNFLELSFAWFASHG